MKLILTFLLTIYSILVLSQTPFLHEKRDYVWLFGSTGIAPPQEWGGTRIDFNFDPPLVSEDPKGMGIWDYNNTMSDADGNLLFYNDHFFIANAAHDTIINGSGLNPIGGGSNFQLWQGCITLPHPGDENLYYMVHQDLKYHPDGLDGILNVPIGLYYTLIDMSEGGEVIEKNQLLMPDTLDGGKISAVRHANGRDWWIIGREFGNTTYYRILLDATGLHVMEDQIIGDIHIRSGYGRADFSPDGTKYAVLNSVSFGKGQWIYYFDFDRCSGLLSNYRSHHFFMDVWTAQSVTFSPNSRFLYANDTRKVWQFDTWEEDFFSAADTIGWIDFSIVPTCANEQMKLAPDGKIYIPCRLNESVMNVIHNPDEQGLAANFEQNGLILPTRGSNVPNHPNYKLGPLDDSLCDTLGIDNVIVSTSNPQEEHTQNFTIFPNPTTAAFTLQCIHPVTKNTMLTLTDAMGRVVLQQSLTNGESNFEIEVADLVRGIYFYSISNREGVVGNGKVVLVEQEK